MDDTIYTEYELEVLKAREKGVELANDANRLLAKNITVGEIVFNMNWCMKRAELVKYDETQGRFVPVDPHFNLDPETMTFVAGKPQSSMTDKQLLSMPLEEQDTQEISEK